MHCTTKKQAFLSLPGLSLSPFLPPSLTGLYSGFERKPDIPDRIAAQTTSSSSSSSQSATNSRIAGRMAKNRDKEGASGKEIMDKETKKVKREREESTEE